MSARVYGGITFIPECGKQVRVIFCGTQKAFLEALGNPHGGKSWMRNHVTETANDTDLNVARLKPGSVFWSPLDSRDYKEMRKHK